MYVLARFQLRILKAFKVTALHQAVVTERKIDLYNKYRKINKKGL